MENYAQYIDNLAKRDIIIVGDKNAGQFFV